MSLQATCDHGMLASFQPQRCSGSNVCKIRNALSGVPNEMQLPILGRSPYRALSLSFTITVALVGFPVGADAAPPLLRPEAHMTLQARQNGTSGGPNPGNGTNDGSQSSPGSISMNVWLPILLLTVVFVLFSFLACIRRCAAGDAAARTATTNANGTGTTAGGNATNTTRPRRRPRRTPSQISTKSLPPYMKEPGDLELVLFRGPAEGEDDSTLPHGMPTLAEDEEEHPEMHGGTYDVSLNRIESIDTMADSSTTNLIRRVSASVPRPPELHHPPETHGHRRSGDARSLDSVGSEAELLGAHQRTISVDNIVDPRGAAPSYTESVTVADGMSTIALDDPQPQLSAVSSDTLANADNVAGRARSRFSFLLHNPFGSHHDAGGAPSTGHRPTPSESSTQHTRSASALSRISSRESHQSHHSRTHSNGNHNYSNGHISHAHSNSALFRAFRSHSPGMHAASSTISLDSISAPLTYTVKRAEFHAPKGGLLTPEQIKLITSREGLERFGVPYGPDAVAAFSKERLADSMGPPPDFESVAGEHQEPSGSGLNDAMEVTAQPTDLSQLSRSASLSPVSPLHQSGVRTASRASSYETAQESDGGQRGSPAQAQTLQVSSPIEDENDAEADDPRTARPLTPTTARPSRHQGSISRRGSRASDGCGPRAKVPL